MNEKPLLEVKNLSKIFDDGAAAVSDVSFSIHDGESVGIVGESGCGKSTTARLIAGLIRPSGGQVFFRGELHVLRPGKGRARINMVFQDPIASFDGRMTVFDSLYEALSHTQSIRKKDARSIIEESLRTVELPASYAERRISQLSGGECQRVGIARALLTQPELLICDEATSALDVSVQAQIIQLLQELKTAKNLTYLFIAHDLALVAGMCTRVLVMYRGRIVEEGDVRIVMHSPIHPYTKLLLASADAFALDENGKTTALPPVAQRLTEEEGACVFYPFCLHCTERCRDEKPELSLCCEGHMVACHRKEEGHDD